MNNYSMNGSVGLSVMLSFSNCLTSEPTSALSTTLRSRLGAMLSDDLNGGYNNDLLLESSSFPFTRQLADGQKE